MPPEVARYYLVCEICQGEIKPGDTVWNCGRGYAHDLCVSMDPEDIEPAG